MGKERVAGPCADLSSIEERAGALDSLTDPVFLMRPVRDDRGSVVDLVYGYVNDAAASLYRQPRADIVGRTQCEMFPSVRELGILDRYIAVLDTGVSMEMEIPNFDENGVAGAFMLECTRLGGDLLIVARDIADERRAEALLVEQTEHLRAVLDGSRDGIARYGPDLRIEYVNKRVEELSGTPVDRWVGRTHVELGYPAEAAAMWDGHIRHVFDTGAPETFTYEVENVEGRGWWEASLSPEFAQDGSVAHVVSTNRDVTARVLAEERLSQLATHDPLTGLANRTGLADELARAVKAGQRTGRPVAILMIDLDWFKIVNDSRGHSAGDRLLCAVAQRLAEVTRGDDFVSRPGGDEFVVVMRDLVHAAEAISAAWRLVEAFRAPFRTEDGELFATISVGVAVAAKGNTAEDLLRSADAAMYAAKAAGRDRVWVFNEDLRASASARLKLEGELRHALERDELRVWYQPEVELATGRMRAVEALLRWQHPDGVLLTADHFVQVAEETGLILAIGPWVFQQACDQAARWARDLNRPTVVRVNISALQLEEPRMLSGIDEALRSSSVDPTLICAEITETAWLRGTETVLTNLTGIHDRGINIAIDDFATGYASLTYLHEYPVNVLKIDRSFIQHIDGNDRDVRLVAGLLALARATGVDVTAEGVENEHQARTLLSLGCPAGQGFLYSQAVPPEQVEVLMDVTFPHR